MGRPYVGRLTYELARDYLGKKKERPIAGNTRLREATHNTFGKGDCRHFIVRFYNTNIIDLYENGDIHFNAGGGSHTTYARLNQFSPPGIRIWGPRKDAPGYLSLTNEVERVLPFNGTIKLAKDLRAYDLTEMNNRDAIKVYRGIVEYSRLYGERMVQGELDSDDGSWLKEMEEEESALRLIDNHIFPLTLIYRHGVPTHVKPFLKENFKASNPNPPKSNKQIIEWMDKKLEGSSLRPKYNSADYLEVKRQSVIFARSNLLGMLGFGT